MIDEQVSIEEKAQKALEVVVTLVSELCDIVSNSSDIQLAIERLRRFHQRAIRLVSEQVHPSEGQRLAHLGTETHLIARMYGTAEAVFKLDATDYKNFLQVLADQLKNSSEDVFRTAFAQARTAPLSEGTKQDSSKIVFIIHGHDETNLLRLDSLLRTEWDLETIILKYGANIGRTIIDKFEEEAQKAAYAIALLTPDDMVWDGKAEYAQARPNVIFELGWFYGRLGRKNVCILFKEGTKIHSDLNGITWIEFTDNVRDKAIDIQKELKEAGLLEK